jgi:hypothetical protein
MTDCHKNSLPITYKIKIRGYLDDHWLDWFDGLTFIHQSDGSTILYGPLPDQSALHGILLKIRDLNLTLVYVTQSGPTTLDDPSAHHIDIQKEENKKKDSKPKQSNSK